MQIKWDYWAERIYFWCCMGISYMLLVGTVQAIEQSFIEATSYTTALKNMQEVSSETVKIQNGRIHELSVRNMKYSRIIRITENNSKLLDRFIKLKNLDRGINDEITKVAIFYSYNIAPNYDIDPDLVLAIGFVESRFSNYFSNTGDYGVMQVNLKIWKEEMGITVLELMTVEKAIDIAYQILERYRVQHGSRYVAAYNGFGKGYEGRVMKVYDYLRKM